MFRSLSILAFFALALADQDLILNLEDGAVEGFYKTSYNGRKFASFEGIPYAAPPIQKYRFKDPQPALKWNGTLKANVVYTCIQLAGGKVTGTEDCLYINVYVPRQKVNPEEKLDVVVHIHGGAFMMGNGHSFSGPSKIMDRDLVYVNFNYRLGPLGFLATEDDVFHGNYGMKDQLHALRWVQANIAKFGGNPDSVTIIGLSAGGASVHLHYFTWNVGETLFHRGWAQSGAAFNPWAVRSSTWPNAKKLITALGCFDESIKVTLRCMRQRTALQLTEAVKTVMEGYLLPLAPFAPNSELMSLNNQNPFLIAHPYVQLKSGHVMDKPFIISQTTDEGMLPAALYYNKLEEVNENWAKMAPLMLEYYYAPEEKQNEASEKIKEFYFKGENITTANFKSFLKLCTQRLFHMGAEKSVKMQANITTENMYFLMFGYPGSENPMKTLYGADIEGIGHGYDAKFMYDIMDIPNRLTPEEERMKEILLDFLVSFAKTGVGITMFRSVSILAFFALALADQDLILILEDGAVEGFYKTSYNGRKFASFEGIPYAAPPIQKYRFKDPQPALKWNGTLKANNVYTCIQLPGDVVTGTEDCLYINVYVPRQKIKPEEKLDVVVHIHGGAFMMASGHSIAGPSKIMDRDLVYVNFNYRLGVLGFLATEDDVFHGNYGMKDQLHALRWVQANIAKFGGNPDSVTIVGGSAGGASVHLHYFTWNVRETLFHRGWAQSGAAFNPWAVRSSSWPNAKKLITALGCFDESIKVTLRCMRQRTALQITEAVKTVMEGFLLPLAPFAPNSELLSLNNQNPFLIAHPYVQLKSGHVMDKPFIISQTTDEGMLSAALYYNKLEEVNENWTKMAPLMLEYYYAPEEKQNEASEKIKEFYFKGENITTANFKSFLKLCTQRLFHMGAEKSVKMQANISTENIYFLMFGYPVPENPMKIMFGADVEGVGHGYDGNLLYDSIYLPGRLTPEEERLKEIYLDFLVSFAKTGKPTSEGIEWAPVPKEGNLKYLLIKSPDDIQMKTTKRLGAYEFWKSLGLKEEENLYHFTDAGIEIQ